MFAHSGSFMVSHLSKALSLQSNIHLGSFFLLEINLIISLFKPFFERSDSIDVTKPCLYPSSLKELILSNV